MRSIAIIVSILANICVIADDGFVPIIQSCIDDRVVLKISPSGNYAWGKAINSPDQFVWNSILGTSVPVDGLALDVKGVTDDGMIYGSDLSGFPALMYPFDGPWIYIMHTDDDEHPYGSIVSVTQNGSFVATCWDWTETDYAVIYWTIQEPTPHKIQPFNYSITALAAANHSSSLRILVDFWQPGGYHTRDFGVWISDLDIPIKSVARAADNQPKPNVMSYDGSKIFGSITNSETQRAAYWLIDDVAPLPAYVLGHNNEEVWSTATVSSTDGNIIVGEFGLASNPMSSFLMDINQSAKLCFNDVTAMWGWQQGVCFGVTMSSNARVFGGLMNSYYCDGVNGFLGQTPWLADTNNDQTVDQLDLDIVLFNLLTEQPAFLNGDVDGSGFVNQDDLDLVLFRFGTETSP